MNEKTLGIILGILLTIVVASASVSITLFFIYHVQPEFLCELCQNDCLIKDLLLIKP